MSRRPKRVQPEPLDESELDEYGVLKNCYCARCVDTRRLRSAMEAAAQMRQLRRQTERHPKRGATAGGVLGDLRATPSWVRP